MPDFDYLEHAKQSLASHQESLNTLLAIDVATLDTGEAENVLRAIVQLQQAVELDKQYITQLEATQ